MTSLDERFFARSELEQSLDRFARRQVERGAERAHGPPLEAFLRDPWSFVRPALAAIRSGRFELQPATPAVVVADKPRTIYKFEWQDEFLLGHLARVLHSVVEPMLPPTLYSFRKGFGSHRALRQVSAWLRRQRGPVFVARRDVREFGQSLEHAFVLEDFRTHARPGPALDRLMEQVCRFPIRTGAGGVTANVRGLPTGANIQLVFENLYLLPLDRALAELGGALALRFGDDLLFATPDRERFRDGTARMAALVERRGVAFKPQKSLDLVLCRAHEVPAWRAAADLEPRCELDYLGARVRHDGALYLPTAKHRRLLAYLRKRLVGCARTLPRDLDAEARIAALGDVVRGLLARDGLASDSPVASYVRMVDDPARLGQVDRWVALSILSLVHRRGFKPAMFRRTPFHRLRELGVPSLRDWRARGHVR